jgi:SNF2 family DNA or RNA helicase
MYLIFLSKSYLKKFDGLKLIAIKDSIDINRQKMVKTIENRMNDIRDNLSKAGYTLYDHQTEGIRWMLERELNSMDFTGGFLCDDPGLGKTLQTLALIAGNSEGGRNLIICPVSLLEQWRDAARKIFPDAKLRICHGPNGSFTNKDEIENTNPFITITSYSKVFNTEKGEYQKTVLHSVKWERVICDEIHIIRNKNSKMFKGCHDIRAKYRWGLSGTPLQNKVADLETLFRYLHVGEVRIKDALIDLKSDYIMRRNRHILPDAYKELDIHIDDIDFATDEEKNFYHNLKDEVRKEFIRVTQDEKNVMSTIFELLLRLRQATIHPSLVYNGLYRKYAEDRDTDPRDLKALLTKIRYWSKRPSTKIKKLIEYFQSHSNDVKSLIFSHFTEEANLIRKFLLIEFPGLRIEIFDGSLSLDQRNEMIKRARNGEIDCLIVQIMAGGVGLNLQMFNKVYMTTPDWNPSNEIQAIARCHRIGQESNVEVIKIIVKEDSEKPTIDERIIHVQQNKRELMSEHLNDESLRFNENIKGSLNLTMKDFAYLLK